jgi:hypothetical protein
VPRELNPPPLLSLSLSRSLSFSTSSDSFSAELVLLAAEAREFFNVTAEDEAATVIIGEAEASL